MTAAADLVHRPHRMLWSYHYARKANIGEVLRKMAHPPVVFADSGGFSALTQGVAIDIGEYADWLIENQSRFEVYANLDAIGDPKATAKNQAILEAKGLKPLPVFHGGAPMKWLDHYADTGHSYIALGGTVGISQRDRMRWFIQAFKWARDRRDKGKGEVVFHGFGVTTPMLLAALPWYSVDSTSWNSGARYGDLHLFDPVAAAWRDVAMFKVPSVLAGADLLRHYGSSPDKFLDRKAYHFTDAVAVCARSWRAFEEHCRRLHGPIRHPDGAAPDGVNLYLAGGSGGDVVTMAANRALADGVNLYMAATSRSDLTAANRALTPGLHLYLADGSKENHVTANLALGGANHDAG